MGLFDTWAWYREKTIYGVVGEDINDYSAIINVDYESGMKTDFGDIRFGSQDGLTNYGYYLKKYTDGVNAVFYVNFGTISDGSSLTFRMYFGKPSVTTTSNGDSTFLFYDNHNDQSIDTSKWIITGNITEDPGGYLRINHTGTINMYAQGKVTFSVGKEITGRVRFGTATPFSNSRESYFGLYNNIIPRTLGEGLLIQEIDGVFKRFNRKIGAVDNAVLTGSYFHDTWYEFKIKWYSDKIIYFVDDVNVGESTNVNAIPTASDLVSFFNSYALTFSRTFNDDMDWVFVRPLATTSTLNEPSQSAWGDKQLNDVSLKFIEPIINKAKEILNNNIQTYINIINGEYSDITLDPIKRIIEGRYFLFDQFPTILIWPNESPGDELDDDRIFARHNITIYILVTDDEQENLHKRIWRYQRAITETIKATENLEETVDICQFAGHVYDSPLGIEDDNLYLEIGGVNFEIENKEEL